MSKRFKNNTNDKGKTFNPNSKPELNGMAEQT